MPREPSSGAERGHKTTASVAIPRPTGETSGIHSDAFWSDTQNLTDSIDESWHALDDKPTGTPFSRSGVRAPVDSSLGARDDDATPISSASINEASAPGMRLSAPSGAITAANQPSVHILSVVEELATLKGVRGAAVGQESGEVAHQVGRIDAEALCPVLGLMANDLGAPLEVLGLGHVTAFGIGDSNGAYFGHHRDGFMVAVCAEPSRQPEQRLRRLADNFFAR